MALTLFNPAPLPSPPDKWDPQYMRQVIRVLEIYFNQLESGTPNYADSYTAAMGFFGPLIPPSHTTTQKNALVGMKPGTIVFDTTLAKLCVYNGTVWQTITSV